MSDITNQIQLLAFIQNNLTLGGHLSIIGLANVCSVKDTSIIRGSAFNSQKLGQTLIEHGFQASALVKDSFNAQATWLVIEYFAFDSKAKAPGAKQLARTFGQLGVQLTFDKLQETKPKTQIEMARENLAILEAMEVLKEEQRLLEEENKTLSEAVDELFDYSSIIRVAKYNDVSEKLYHWRKLKAASTKLDEPIKKVPCPRFETKNLYSHNAWRLAYPDSKLPETTTLVISN